MNEIYEIIFNYDDVKEKDGCKLQLWIKKKKKKVLSVSWKIAGRERMMHDVMMTWAGSLNGEEDKPINIYPLTPNGSL